MANLEDYQNFLIYKKKRGKKKDIRYKEKIIKNEQEEKLNYVAKETAAVTKLNFFTFLNTF